MLFQGVMGILFLILIAVFFTPSAVDDRASARRRIADSLGTEADKSRKER